MCVGATNGLKMPETMSLEIVQSIADDFYVKNILKPNIYGDNSREPLYTGMPFQLSTNALNCLNPKIEKAMSMTQ